MRARGDDAACTGAGVRKPSMKETAMGEGWWCGLTYMSRALSSPISRPPLHFRPFFCSIEPILSSRPWRLRSAAPGHTLTEALTRDTDPAARTAVAVRRGRGS
jgi:hypothetical protein